MIDTQPQQQQQQQTTNGHHYTHENDESTKFINQIDPEDPEYIRELQRPADVKEDMRQMEARQRVSSILNSQAFREELESIIADQLKHGPHSASLIALQQISDLLLPNTNSRSHQSATFGKGLSNNMVVPINDIRGIDCVNYSKGERLARCKLAALFRLIDLFGWNNSTCINNCNSIRFNSEMEHFLVNPHGLMFHEVTASGLIKIDIHSHVIENGSTTYGPNKMLFQLHSAIYKARPDIKCILHAHTSTTNAVSSLKCGLLPLTQEAILCGNISYHDYRGANNYQDKEIKSLLSDDLGPLNKVMFVRNYGLVACGETIEEAWFYLLNVMNACETQLKLMPMGIDNLLMPSEDQKKRFIDMYNQQLNETNVSENKNWKIGEMEYEACMRCLDNASYRTGYIYRQPIVRSIDRTAALKDIEIPPHCASFGINDSKARLQSVHTQKSSEWINTPNTYAKTELAETGPFPKKVTKWVTESSPNKTSTPIRIETKQQFAPQGADPKELKKHQTQIKQDRLVDKKTPGHQSKLLDNLPDDNAVDVVDSLNKNYHSSDTALSSVNQSTRVKKRYLDDRVDAGPKSRVLTDINEESLEKSSPHLNGDYHGSPTSTTYVYGAASKGIIKRDQQHNSSVYKSYQAAPNPFQSIDQNDIEKYKKDITEKQLKDQVQKKDNMHRELLDKSANSAILIESALNSDVKKKSNTIPRSKSLLDKKSREDGRASSSSSRENSPTTKKNSTISGGGGSGVAVGSSSSNKLNQSSSSSVAAVNANKSATLSTSSVNKEVKPKKKSKLRSLSFLKSKKSKEQQQQQAQTQNQE